MKGELCIDNLLINCTISTLTKQNININFVFGEIYESTYTTHVQIKIVC